VPTINLLILFDLLNFNSMGGCKKHIVGDVFFTMELDVS